jgi:hypothetical protein
LALLVTADSEQTLQAHATAVKLMEIRTSPIYWPDPEVEEAGIDLGDLVQVRLKSSALEPLQLVETSGQLGVEEEPAPMNIDAQVEVDPEVPFI